MEWKTKITQMTKTKYPLIMAAFARWSTTDFAASFSNAGGLGIITALNYDLNSFKNELTKMKSLTDKPFGVNITVDPPKEGQAQESYERAYLQYLNAALDAGVSIFTCSAYQAPFIGKRIHEAGGYWFHKCSLLRHALSAQRHGADAITIIGLEASGYKNPYMHTTLVNLTIANKLIHVPVIAAGGIGDARGLLGALIMGADAVCLGTAILTTEESSFSPERKDQWLNVDILTEEYHRELYHLKLKGTRVPSPAVAFQKEIVPLKDFVENMMDEAEGILRSLGFNKTEFNSINGNK